ncbi:nitrite/sulfite reductase [Kribbella antibiotica]|uniref:nitrite/sulfite reductase n=1 Tax=Kribbella antibiotica TaxID=190195 RepID=UPI001EDD4601|nr:nitrite/sulfite reductase [Kribbella antibiotica]
MLAVHQAADGGLARIRVPGGLLSVTQLDVLRSASLDLGDGRLELTSRGNLQIRALRPDGPQELSDRLYRAGLLPSLTHERVRNILVSPLSGLDGRYDVLPLASALDRALCAHPGLAELPGRFLFALDDGRGDLVDSGADVLVQAVDSRTALLSLGTRGVRLDWGEVVEVMLAAAAAFLEVRDAAEWRIAEVVDGERRIFAQLGLEPTDEPLVTGVPVEAGVHGSARVVTVPLGSLTSGQAAVLAELAEWIRVTPWRSVVLPAVASAPLEAVGLITTPDSAWSGVTACAGQPGCAKALADVRSDAWQVMPRLVRDGRRVHWSGCERRCGKPAGVFVDILAVGNGYLVDGEFRETW